MRHAMSACFLATVVIMTGCSSDRDDDASCRIASLVVDVWPGAGSSYPGNIVAFDNRLYFTANDGVHGEELWMYSPGTGAELVVDIVPGSGGSAPRNLTVLDGSLYFSAQDSGTGRELWAFDPAKSAAGAERVADINPGSDGSDPSAYYDRGLPSGGFIVVDGRLYFEADDGVHGDELWMYDLVAGAALVADIRPGEVGADIEQFTVIDDTLYFTAFTDRRRNLWFLDTASDSVNRVDIRVDPDVYSSLSSLTVYDGRLYFSANDGVSGHELWAHDPMAGPMLVADIAPGSDSSYPSGLTVMAGRLYLAADDGIHGGELWVYDPNDGIALAADIAPSAGYAMRSSNLTELDGTLYFFAYNDLYGEELWRYDPSIGATLVVDTVPGLGDNGDDDPEPPSRLRVFDGRLYFEAFDQMTENRRTTWVYDPLNGPEILTEVWPGSGIDEIPYRNTEFNGELYFSIDDDVHGRELWAADADCYG